MKLTSYTVQQIENEIKEELYRIWLESDLEDWYLSQSDMRDLHILYRNLLKEQS